MIKKNSMLKKICLFFAVICPAFAMAAGAAPVESRKTTFLIPNEVLGRHVGTYLARKDWFSLALVCRQGFQAAAAWIDPIPY